MVGNNYMLEDVLFIPNFSVNLVSARKLTKRGCKITLDDDICSVNKEGQEVIRAKADSSDIYVLLPMPKALITTVPKEEDPGLWHRRLGHLHMAGVKALESMAHGVAFQKGQKEDTAVCVPCVEGKQHKHYRRHDPVARMTRRLE